MNVVFACDRSYIAHLAVALCSLFENNLDLPFDVYILNPDMDPDSWGKIAGIARRYKRLLIDIKITDQEVGSLVTGSHFTKATYYRLYIPEFVPGDIAFFLDADIVVAGSIEELTRISLSDHYLGAVFSPGIIPHEDLQMDSGARYFNAGIMLINLEAWRRDHIKEKVIDVIGKKPWAIHFVDQDGLNSVVNGRWKDIHPKFNVQGCFFETGVDTYAEHFPAGDLLDAVRHPVIIHYSGSGKPWHFGYKHPYRGLYWKYLRLTPFNRLFSEDLTVLRFFKHLVPKALKKALKNLRKLQKAT